MEKESLLKDIKIQLQEILSNNSNTELPLLPQIAMDVMAMTSDDSSPASALCDLIHKDQALAATVLKISNSALYAGNTEIVSLQQAITRLGMSLISEIAVSASLKNGVFKAKGFADEMNNIWKHSLGSGLFAKEIARLKRYNVESAYLSGLLHTIGKTVILQTSSQIDKNAGTVLASDDLHLLYNEFSVNIGYMLTTLWELPEQVRMSVKYYSDYSGDEKFIEDIMATALADKMALNILGSQDYSEESLRSEKSIIDLNIYPEEFNELLLKKEKITESIEVLS